MTETRKSITRTLSRKGIALDCFEYARSIPTPHGYERGWNISLSEESQIKISERAPNFCDWEPELDNLSELSDWVENLPDCSA